MSLYDQANIDIQQITSNKDEWGLEITLTSPTGEIAVVAGMHAKHWLGVDTSGNVISSKTAHIAFSEQNLIKANAYYPIRNLLGEVDFDKHRVDVKDSTGIVKNYVMQSWHPDETVGLLTCIIEDYDPNN
ncbi:MAG TPA: hypothetical protein VN922_01690 [Bacteroidia bacterium]|nr:hypothetical protein [Bacteroidia bacterium]